MDRLVPVIIGICGDEKAKALFATGCAHFATETPASTVEDAPVKKRRGRPPGSKNKLRD